VAGDWIKVEKATPTKMEVLAISELLEIHPAHAFGLCVKFWMWCDDHLTDGNAKRVTKKTLDYVIGHDGMTDALLKVDWLRDRSGSLEVPHFDRHLSEGAKNRALTKERVRKSKAKSNETSVAKVTHTPLPEKRREEKREEDNRAASPASVDNGSFDIKDPPPPPKPKRFQKPTVDQIAEYAFEINAGINAETFFDYYESKGWMIGKTPMKDWKASVRTWKRSSNPQPATAHANGFTPLFPGHRPGK
jgi:hypothetical protein